MSERIYFKNLDILRFFAFCIVFVSHVSYQWGFGFLTFLIQQGNLGVDFFFLISGFLISYLLIQEKKTVGNISLSKFYIRRGLRIWPLYFFIIFTIILVQTTLGHISELPRAIYLYGIFLGNFDRVYNGFNTVSQLPGFGVLWSISVEEQFYFLIPIVLFSIRSVRNILWGTIIFHLLSIVYKIYVISIIRDTELAFRVLSFHSFSKFDFISFGCMIACLIIFYRHTVERFIEFITWTMVGLLAVISFVLQYVSFNIKSIYFDEILLPEFYCVFFGIVVMFICFNTRVKKMENSIISLFNYLGKISYGLYLYHFPIIYLLKYFKFSNGFFLAVTSIALTIVIAHISFIFLEKPFLNLKTKFEVIKSR